MRRKLIITTLCVLSVAVGAAGAIAYSGPSPSDARKHAVESRADNFNRAAALIPDPRNTNFPIRRALRQMNDREDMLNHPWFVYLLGQNGNTIGYYVAKWPPINGCDFLSSTEDVWTNDKTALKMQSPSYDGVYYGGSLCNTWVIFDATTNAEIKIGGLQWYVSDQPLKLDAQAIKVKRG